MFLSMHEKDGLTHRGTSIADKMKLDVKAPEPNANLNSSITKKEKSIIRN